MRILLNALGIVDSGGITVLDKCLIECVQDVNNKYFIIVHDDTNINELVTKYKDIVNIKFNIIKNKCFLYRLYYENIIFRNIIRDMNIDLVYNFSGSAQLFLKVSQITKIHNLLFYSRELDDEYFKKHQYLKWIKQIFIKRIILKFMLNYLKYLEIQSSHVKKYLSDYINVKNKIFYIKSDIEIDDNLFFQAKIYDFTKKIKFLYIVGPHFEYIHKNFIDFVHVMIELKKRNIDFEINITLTKEQLRNSDMWDNTLNNMTNFMGYISDKKELDKLFSDNTILISTSIIETLGLHVIEGIKNGIVPIVPNEIYSKSVYGKNIITYELFNSKSLLNSILSTIRNKIDYKNYILTLQNDLKVSEKSKYKSIIDIFEKVANV